MTDADRSIEWVNEHVGPSPHDLGGGVSLSWSTRDGSVVGAIRDHPRPDGGPPCSSSVLFDVPAVGPFRDGKHAIHALVSWEPLHLEPSLLCRTCGSHGFVRDGRWVPA